jgi:hypothetical protein
MSTPPVRIALQDRLEDAGVDAPARSYKAAKKGVAFAPADDGLFGDVRVRSGFRRRQPGAIAGRGVFGIRNKRVAGHMREPRRIEEPPAANRSAVEIATP